MSYKMLYKPKYKQTNALCENVIASIIYYIAIDPLQIKIIIQFVMRIMAVD